MGVFGIGPMELFIVMVVALLIFGPGRLPEVMAGLGRTIRTFRRMSAEMTAEVSRFSEEFQEIKDSVTSVVDIDEIKRTIAEATSMEDIREALNAAAAGTPLETAPADSPNDGASAGEPIEPAAEAVSSEVVVEERVEVQAAPSGVAEESVVPYQVSSSSEPWTSWPPPGVDWPSSEPAAPSDPSVAETAQVFQETSEVVLAPAAKVEPNGSSTPLRATLEGRKEWLARRRARVRTRKASQDAPAATEQTGREETLAPAGPGGEYIQE